MAKNHFGIEVDHRRDHPIDFARKGKEGSVMLYWGWSLIGLRRPVTA